MFYTITMPWLVRKMYPTLTWEKPADQKTIYLTFDDGPHPAATPFVLDTLASFNAKATFFCIGKNVAAHMDIYKRIIAEGHGVGNHTFNHLNGWKTSNEQYFNDIFEAAKYIDSSLFRPPYGRINKFQVKLLQKENSENRNNAFHIIMWSVLSGDFDVKLSPQKCLSNVILHTRPGSIIVFHDSTKAWERMSYALPLVLEHFCKAGYRFSALET
ncbi:polysaccharide deacetylase family protein [Panacibacter sp. DH6]|uniref:Polysaccharide deacetylase family protein n=1 Tax=Panacibacter microcysteis TaxID=2793269 RepID=A0A931E556_9BACT|nr:polysaccharide deacetylase family protein [Panacibacter microcysteis]MBG9375470.1 polysaccharide deacetylase family protein [Panacibacter microcysteis]